MTRLSRAEIARIIKRDAPKSRIVRRSSVSKRKLVTPDAQSGDIDTIRRRYGVARTSK